MNVGLAHEKNHNLITNEWTMHNLSHFWLHQTWLTRPTIPDKDSWLFGRAPLKEWLAWEGGGKDSDSSSHISVAFNESDVLPLPLCMSIFSGKRKNFWFSSCLPELWQVIVKLNWEFLDDMQWAIYCDSLHLSNKIIQHQLLSHWYGNDSPI